MRKPQEILLQASGVSVHYPGGQQAAAVDGVSFDLGAGRTLAIIGESGAGKSTLALAIAGLAGVSASVSGRLMFEGNDLFELGEEQMCRVRGSGIGMIFQDPRGSLDPTMKVIDQVAEPLRLHQGLKRGEAHERARRMLAGVDVHEGLLEVAPYAHQLSGGLCQRVMIAAALAADPRLLIADEPTSSLDLTLQAQVIELIRSRQREMDLGVIFITHDLALASAVGDEIAVMHGGSFVETGAAAQLLGDPVHPYTKELVGIWKDGALAAGARHAVA